MLDCLKWATLQGIDDDWLCCPLAKIDDVVIYEAMCVCVCVWGGGGGGGGVDLELTIYTKVCLQWHARYEHH